MVLNKINKLRKDRGFTIVELLIVIVVIGILAAIVIVAYSGITARANLQKSLTNATAMRDVAESSNADIGVYPATTGAFTTGTASTHLPTGIVPQHGGTSGTAYTLATATSAAVSTTTSISTPTFFLTGTQSAPTGGVIFYWDPTLSTPAVSSAVIYYGAATASSSFIGPAS